MTIKVSLFLFIESLSAGRWLKGKRHSQIMRVFERAGQDSQEEVAEPFSFSAALSFIPLPCLCFLSTGELEAFGKAKEDTRVSVGGQI